MKDISTPVPQNEVRSVIKKSLENAALVNYERLSEEARIEGRLLILSSLHFWLTSEVHYLFFQLSTFSNLNFLFSADLANPQGELNLMSFVVKVLRFSFGLKELSHQPRFA